MSTATPQRVLAIPFQLDGEAGHILVGPFNSDDDAVQYAEKYYPSDDHEWTVIDLRPPFTGERDNNPNPEA